MILYHHHHYQDLQLTSNPLTRKMLFPNPSIAAVVFGCASITSSVRAFKLTHSLYRSRSLLATVVERDDNSWIESLVTKGVVIKDVDVATLSGGLRGIVATTDTASNSVAVVVPAALAIETNNNRPPTPFPAFCSEEFWSKQAKWDHRLCFKLLYEIKGLETDDKKASLRKEWIQQLPTSFSTPLHWQDNQIAFTEYPALTQKVQQQRRDWKLFYDQWIKDTGRQSSVVSFEEFVWALECVNSRAFSGPYEGSTAAERKALLFFTGLLTVAWPLLGFGSPEQALSAAVFVGISSITKDYFFSQAAGLKRYVICPYIDMFNHRSTCSSDVSYGYFSDSFELKTEMYKKGEQVYISYGKQTNDRLLQFYGFIDEDNPYDVYDFGIGFIDLIIKYADAISTKVPQKPTPKERLEQIAEAITRTNVQILSSSSTDKKAKAVVSPLSCEDLTTRYFRTPPAALKGNQMGGLTDNFDDITVRAMRALYSSTEEWEQIIVNGQLPSLDNLGTVLSTKTEQTIAIVLTDILRLELQQKTTTLDEDMRTMNDMRVKTTTISQPTSNDKEFIMSKSTALDPSGWYSSSDFSALSFRIQKKKILSDALQKASLL